MNALVPLGHFWRWISRQQHPCGESRSFRLSPRNTVARIFREKETLLCVRGVLWITSDLDAEDTLLQAGEKFSVSRRTSLVIEALDESIVKW